MANCFGSLLHPKAMAWDPMWVPAAVKKGAQTAVICKTDTLPLLSNKLLIWSKLKTEADPSPSS